MLTRFEVSGFKNLRDVVVDFGRFTCVAGANGVGKSNLFDAIDLLSALSRSTFVEAISGVRSSGAAASGSAPSLLTLDLRSLFPSDVLDGQSCLVLAAEMIVPPEVRDNLDEPVEVANTYWRYEVALRIVPDTASGYPVIQLASEDLTALDPTTLSQSGRPDAPELSRHIRSQAASAPIRTVRDAHGKMTVEVASGARRHVREVQVDRVPRTVLSAAASADLPSLLAVRQEMLSWRFLALEPSAMRSPDAVVESRDVDDLGAHVPASLYRAQREDPRVVDRVRDAVSDLVDVRSLRVVDDPARQTLELRATIGQAPELPARSLSDGTLRFLVLATIGYTSSHVGLLAVEEPENGIHPAKLRAMVDLLQWLAQPRHGLLRQVLVNTHSPYMVDQIMHSAPQDLLVAKQWTTRDQAGEQRTTTAFHPLPGTWRASAWTQGAGTSSFNGLPTGRAALTDFVRNPFTPQDEA